MSDVIHPPAMLGILGGGQLGRFFVIAAQKMGYQVTVLDPDKKSPAGKIAQNHICKPYNDFDAINELKNLCDAVTTEFENIPSSTLELLEKDIVVCPGSKAVSIVQIISLAVIPGTINYMYISKFLGNLKNKIILFSSIIFLISIILGMIILGQLYDVQGIAAAFVLANTVEAIFLLIADKFYNMKKDKIG